MKIDGETLDQGLVRPRWRVLDYIELMKPELTGLSVLTALCGFYLGNVVPLDISLCLSLAVGTLLVGGGAGALNQYLERDYDARMKRTENRPLPAGRVRPTEVFWFGVSISFAGISVLILTTNLLTGFLAALTITTYLFLYTPLKRLTPVCTWVGAIVGALPPMMGWTAVRNEVTLPAVVLFAILFFWQIPHFHSLAWLYRKDYLRAGFKMLTAVDENGSRTSVQILLSSAALIPISLGLTVFGVTGLFYLLGASFLGALFLACGILFARSSYQEGSSAFGRTNLYARRMFSASLLYLPALMVVIVIDKI